MIAFISDLHSNLEALTAVLEDMERHRPERIVCLGDVVGYGPDPAAVADLARARVALAVKGNHDEALVAGAIGFSPIAKRAIDWTRSGPEPGFFSGRPVRERWAWPPSLPRRSERARARSVPG